MRSNRDRVERAGQEKFAFVRIPQRAMSIYRAISQALLAKFASIQSKVVAEHQIRSLDHSFNAICQQKVVHRVGHVRCEQFHHHIQILHAYIQENGSFGLDAVPNIRTGPRVQTTKHLSRPELVRRLQVFD